METITQPTPVLLPRVPTARHQYNLCPKRQLAYSCTQTSKLYVATNVITSMEANSRVHLVTGLCQEYRNLITGDEKVTWKGYFSNELGKLAQGIRTTKSTNAVFFIPNHKVPFITKTLHMEKIYVTSNQIKLKHIAPG